MRGQGFRQAKCLDEGVEMPEAGHKACLGQNLTCALHLGMAWMAVLLCFSGRVAPVGGSLDDFWVAISVAS